LTFLGLGEISEPVIGAMDELMAPGREVLDGEPDLDGRAVVAELSSGNDRLDEESPVAGDLEERRGFEEPGSFFELRQELAFGLVVGRSPGRRPGGSEERGAMVLGLNAAPGCDVGFFGGRRETSDSGGAAER
jgi:hypothetical protein